MLFPTLSLRWESSLIRTFGLDNPYDPFHVVVVVGVVVSVFFPYHLFQVLYHIAAAVVLTVVAVVVTNNDESGIDLEQTSAEPLYPAEREIG